MQAHLSGVLTRAHQHKGTSFVEVFQNCVVFNDGVFDDFTEKSVAPDRQVLVEQGKPLLFGKDKSKGIRLNPATISLEVVSLGENGVTEADVLRHDETNRTLAGMLLAMEPPEFPVALGVVYCNPATPFEKDLYAQLESAGAWKGEPDLADLFKQERTWTVE
jgi:2-oxoglutarate ferredoxin oxidoreductase subunit beta